MAKCAALNKGELTEEERLELDLKVENELLGKKRQFNYLNQGGKHGKMPGTTKMVRQKKALNIIKSESFNLSLDLSIANSQGKKKQDQTTVYEMQDLLGDYQSLTDQIQLRKTQLKEVDEEISKIKRLIHKRRKLTVSDYNYTKMVQEGEKQVDLLENKLETNLKGFCKILTTNHKLRTEIQHLMIGRRDFNTQWNFVVGNLNKGKRFMMDIVEQASLAYDQREEWCTKLQALRTRAHMDLTLQTEEMNNLQYQLNHERKMEDFIGKKCQKRIMRDLEIQKRNNVKQRRLTLESNLKKYNQMLQSITEFMNLGTTNVDQIVYKYMQIEEKNYSEFGYLCVLGKEIEDLSEQIYKYHTDIDVQRNLRKKRTIQQDKRLKILQRELETATRETQKMQTDYDKLCASLGTLCAGVQKLFTICKCNATPLLQLLGNNSCVNNENVLLHLNLLEDEIKRLLMVCYYQQKRLIEQKGKKIDEETLLIKDNKVPGTILGIDDIVSSNPCPLCVDLEMVSDVIDDLQKVDTIDEVAEKLGHRLTFPDALERVHNVSACHLPKSRQIIQKRYQ